MARETKEARAERQARELWRFVDVLRRAGNQVSEEFPVIRDRKWKIDLVVSLDVKPHEKMRRCIAIEIEGYGRHQSWKGWHADLEKYNAIAALGWPLIRVTREMVANGDALETLARCGIPVEAKEAK